MAKIVNLTEAASIGFHSMIIIAQQGNNGQINVNHLAEKTGSSKFHISKVMQKLVKDGFLGSHRGPAGGFYLAKPPEEITLLEIYEAIEGKLEVTKCPLARPTCPFSACIFEGVTVKMTRDFRDFIRDHTLAYYVNKK
ncbi:Rrf2 family transcriptional regulator [Candidatus Sulfidibacterium hydrothermale]|uniref:RrF2 family transcriptional regulator n=1 Tax=Candidatus Sulfidibacterium hydrothermale TaxID=2875962 RepID=UPI001F0ABCAD|nr:Rrf2 family transcriptional regulator [Candidatus Sulfidibacterium hydrothermale]UBM62000.1 Rrf2 family transcriptional regulator [Candidatus Sulfidibacterium hydrothermale]